MCKRIENREQPNNRAKVESVKNLTVWIEMARYTRNPNGPWAFGNSLWAPTRKRNGSEWVYWSLLKKVKMDDVVVHIKWLNNQPNLLGSSIAAEDCYVTNDVPENLGDAEYSNEFYYVPLKDNQEFQSPISLKQLFLTKERALIDYYERNRNLRRVDRKLLFYVLQRSRLQCLNGAYLSEADADLIGIIFERQDSEGGGSAHVQPSISTGTAAREVFQRIGQSDFSRNVRNNYNHTCCFPGCTVDNDHFLVGSHIARWADEPDLRGDVSNGLCLCLMHDRAFEIGLFTLTDDYKVHINSDYLSFGSLAGIEQFLKPYEGMQIKLGRIHPRIEAILIHRQRVSRIPSP